MVQWNETILQTEELPTEVSTAGIVIQWLLHSDSEEGIRYLEQ